MKIRPLVEYSSVRVILHKQAQCFERLANVRVVDVFRAHGLLGQRVPQLQVAQRQEASQELSAEAGQQL